MKHTIYATFVAGCTSDLDSLRKAEHFHCLPLFVTPMVEVAQLTVAPIFFPADAFIPVPFQSYFHPFPISFRPPSNPALGE